MFIAIHWTFRDSGSLLSLHSSHLGGWQLLALYIFHTLMKNRIFSFCFLPSLNHKFTSYPSNLEGRGGLLDTALAVSDPPKWPLNAALSWDRWTVLKVDTLRQYSPAESCFPSRWEEKNKIKNERKTHDREKSATVLKTYAHFLFHTDSKATRKVKERSLASVSPFVFRLVEHSRQLDYFFFLYFLIFFFPWITQKSYPNQ